VTRVCVIIPCFNDGAFVGDAVSSIREAQPVEIVVVDDGSTDGTTLPALERLAASGAARVVYREHGGLSATRMTGLEATTAPYVFPLDADDRLEPGCLARLADLLDAEPSIAFAFGHGTFLGESEGWQARPWDPFLLLYLNGWGPSCLFRREAIVGAGGWSMPDCYEDWDFLLALAEHDYTGAPIDSVVLHYRRHQVARKHTGCLRRHRELYRLLRRRHAALFARRGELADRSPLPRWQRVWLPVRHGSRPLLPYHLYWWLRGRHALRPHARRA
jgi:glycosyltransferase involved in cell wall biosynthesis